MSKSYRTIVSMSYQSGIYERCSAGIAIRTDKQRARIWVDTVRWRNNTGSLYHDVSYLSVDRAARVLRAFRAARACYDLGNGRGHSPFEVLSAQLESNWDNAPASIIKP